MFRNGTKFSENLIILSKLKEKYQKLKFPANLLRILQKYKKKPELKAFILIAASSSKGRIDPEKDIYAIPSRSTENREIYFLALVDILTHYGMKKQAAKVAKTGLAT